MALTNNNARILWVVMALGEAFDAGHLSTKSGGAAAPTAPWPYRLEQAITPASLHDMTTKTR